jgi:hypothetical protein
LTVKPANIQTRNNRFKKLKANAMRQLSCLLLLLSIAVTTVCQDPLDDFKKQRRKKIANYAITSGLVLLAGASDGVNQAIMYQYGGFKRAFPGANDKFWKPALSGANKYKNGDPRQGARFPGSRTWLVFLTDGYHLTRFADHLFMSGAIAVKISGYQKKKWYIYAVETVGYWLINRAGFCLTYNRFICYP